MSELMNANDLRNVEKAPNATPETKSFTVETRVALVAKVRIALNQLQKYFIQAEVCGKRFCYVEKGFFDQYCGNVSARTLLEIIIEIMTPLEYRIGYNEKVSKFFINWEKKDVDIEEE